MFRIPMEFVKQLGGSLHDYDFPLIEADFVDPEDYRTDLKEFFRAMQCRGDRTKLRRLLQTEEFQRLRPETEQVIARHLHIGMLVHKMEKEGFEEGLIRRITGCTKEELAAAGR